MFASFFVIKLCTRNDMTANNLHSRTTDGSQRPIETKILYWHSCLARSTSTKCGFCFSYVTYQITFRQLFDWIYDFSDLLTTSLVRSVIV